MLRFHELQRPGSRHHQQNRVIARSLRTVARAQPRTPADRSEHVPAPALAALLRAASGVVLPAVLALTVAAAPACAAVELSAQHPLYDGAKIISSQQRPELAERLSEFERSSGWKLRVLTSYGQEDGPSDADRRSWGLDQQ